MRLNHTEVVSADELESIHQGSLTILERIGMDVWDGEALSLLGAAGADVDEHQRHVRFPRELILEHIANAPAEFTLHSWNPERNLRMGGRWMANGTVGSAPNIVGLDGVRRTGDRAGFNDLLKLAHMLNSIHFVGGYPVEPIDIHPSVRHIHAAFDVLTLTDKHIHCYSLGRQKNRDCIEMTRIARGVDDATLEREPSIFTVINSNSPLRLDTPMLHGTMEMASRVSRSYDPVHPRRCNGAGRWRRTGAAEREALAASPCARSCGPAPRSSTAATSNVDMRSGAPRSERPSASARR
jgi:trimethylamine--corrinoid protein Co-methyltransferase